MSRKIYLYITLLIAMLSLTSCFVEVEKAYTFPTEEVCKCYTSSTTIKIDDRLDDCIKPFNKFISELSESNSNKKEIEELGKEGLLLFMDELTKKCPKYRESFLQLTLDKFGNLPKSEALETISQSEKGNQFKIDTLKLVDSYLTVTNRNKANEILDVFITKHPNADYALWMKSYSYYMDKKLLESVEVIESAIRVTNSQEMKTVLGLYRNSINPLITDTDDEITIKHTN